MLAGLKAKAQHSEIESGERLSDHAASQVVYSPLHDELLARQAVFAISVGRLMDGVELSALGLRHRLAQRIGANPVEDDPRLIVVAQRVLVRRASRRRCLPSCISPCSCMAVARHVWDGVTPHRHCTQLAIFQPHCDREFADHPLPKQAGRHGRGCHAVSQQPRGCANVLQHRASSAGVRVLK